MVNAFFFNYEDEDDYYEDGDNDYNEADDDYR
jgi:hypothetical protein